MSDIASALQRGMVSVDQCLDRIAFAAPLGRTLVCGISAASDLAEMLEREAARVLDFRGYIVLDLDRCSYIPE